MNKKTLAIIIGGLMVLGIIFWVVSFVLKPPVVEEVGPWPGMPLSDFEGTLYVFEWEDYDDPGLWNVGESAFNEIYPNVKPEFTFFADETDALDKLKAGIKADIVHGCGGSLMRYYNAGVLEPMDISLIPNWQQMNEAFRNFAKEENKGTPVKGEIYFAPLEWGYSTVMYRNDLLDELGIPENERDTFNLLFDPRLKGEIMIIDSPDEIYPIVALAAGIPPYEIWNPTDEQLEIMKNKLLEQRPLIKAYWPETGAIVEAVAAGEIAAVNIWGESYLVLKEMGVDVTFSFPKEGIVTWLCGFSIVKGLKERDPDLYAVAHAFINAWMDKQAGANIIDTMLYGHSNQQAHVLAKEKEIVKAFHFDDPTVLQKSVFWQEPLRIEEFITIWNEVKVGE